MLVLVLTGCAEHMSPEQYTDSARVYMDKGDHGHAMEILRKALYRYPDDYRANLYMGRTLFAASSAFIPGSRRLYLARYYLKRASNNAPDAASAALAMELYRSVRDRQGLKN